MENNFKEDLDQVVALANKLQSAMVIVENIALPELTAFKHAFDVIGRVCSKNELILPPPHLPEVAFTDDFFAAEFQKAIERARSGNGRVVSCELVSDGPVKQIVKEGLGDISALRSTSGATVGIGFAAEGTLGVGNFLLSGQVAGGFYIAPEGVGLYGCISGVGFTVARGAELEERQALK